MLILLEGAFMCLLLSLICVVGIANGPQDMVMFYEKDVQQRAIELGLTTKKHIKKTMQITSLLLFLPVIVLVPAMVYWLNGARGFLPVFWQITGILMIQGLFDRLFIDWYWVEHTNAWHIPGTEDLMPYIPRKIKRMKWIGTLVGYPLWAAMASGILLLF